MRDVGTRAVDPSNLVGEAHVFRGFRGTTRRVVAFVAGFILPSTGFAQAFLWQVQGSAPATVFGERIQSAGDYDGDGVEDLLIGEPGYNPGGMPDAGRVTLWSGANQSLLLGMTATQGGGGWGRWLGHPGDLTGDGAVEFMVGYYVSVGWNWEPWTHVVTAAGTVISSWSGNGTVGGDLNGDGAFDLLVGDPSWFNPLCAYDHGRAYALSGAAGPLLAEWTGGMCLSESFGYFPEPAGDVNGDGMPDFVLPSSGGWNTYTAAAVGLYSGLGATPVWIATLWGGVPATSIAAPVGLAFVGDVNGDGVEDLLTGFPGDDVNAPFTSNPTGMARVFSGSNGALLAVIGGSHADQKFGRSVARVGDLDGDGLADLLIGGSFRAFWQPPTPPSSNWVWNTSSAQGGAYVYGGGNTFLLVELLEPPPLDGFGSDVEGMGDLNGDEYPDFAVSEPWRAPPAPGRVLVYSGAPAGVSVFGSGCAGSGGFVPRIAAWPSATLGFPLRLSLSRALAQRLAVLVLGLTNTHWYAIPLPLSLGFLGMPGCALQVSPDWVIPVGTVGSGPGSGRATVSVQVPADPALSGASIFAQWYVADPGPGALPGVVTRGLQVTIQ